MQFKKDVMTLKGTAQDIFYNLLDVVNQSCQVEATPDKNYTICDHMCISAYEDALDVLEYEGYAIPIKRGKHRGKYKLYWECQTKESN